MQRLKNQAKHKKQRAEKKLLEALVGTTREDRDRIMRGCDPVNKYSFQQMARIKFFREQLRRSRNAI